MLPSRMERPKECWKRRWFKPWGTLIGVAKRSLNGESRRERAEGGRKAEKLSSPISVEMPGFSKFALWGGGLVVDLSASGEKVERLF